MRLPVADDLNTNARPPWWSGRVALIRTESVFGRLQEAWTAMAENFRDRELRLAQLSFGFGWTSEWAFTVALSVVAFEDGGTRAVGLVALVRLAPSAVLGPVMATLGDRFRRELLLGWIGIVRALAIGLSGLLLWSSADLLQVYILALVATTVLTPFRAAHSALLPTLCKTPEQLTSAMATRGLLDSLSILLGPLVATAVLDVSSMETTFEVVAGFSLLSAVLILRVRYEASPVALQPAHRSGLWRQTVEGVQEIYRHHTIALGMAMGAVQGFTRGCLTVFTVVVSIRVLGLGTAGVGVLNMAVGVGALIGSVGVSLLAGSRRLGSWYSAGIAAWGLPLALIGAWRTGTGTTVVLLAVIGVANALVDVTFFTLIGRVMDDRVLSRVNGVFETMVSVAVGVGSVVTPFVITLLGIRGALIALGMLCPVAAASGWWRLHLLDRSVTARTEEIGLLRSVPMFHVLPVVTLEQLAGAVRTVTFRAGQQVFAQGSPGHTFYVIRDGVAEVTRDDRLVRTLGPGDYFGEIALLQDVPRTATIRARSDLRLAELTREVFIPVVTGYSASADAAAAAIDERLAVART